MSSTTFWSWCDESLPQDALFFRALTKQRSALNSDLFELKGEPRSLKLSWNYLMKLRNFKESDSHWCRWWRRLLWAGRHRLVSLPGNPHVQQTMASRGPLWSRSNRRASIPDIYNQNIKYYHTMLVFIYPKWVLYFLQLIQVEFQILYKVLSHFTLRAINHETNGRLEETCWLLHFEGEGV